MKKGDPTKPGWGDVAFALEVARRAIRRTISRSELLRRVFRMPRHPARRHAPGLLLIQIDGLGHRQLQRAISQGWMPFLGALIERENYRLYETYSGLPSATPAVQAELYYNVRGAVPAFGFLNREQRRFAIMYDPEVARRVEADLVRQGEEPLLRGGSSWCNVFAGGAGPDECHFCSVSLRLSEMLRRTSFLSVLIIGLFHLPAMIRTVLLGLRELAASSWEIIRALWRPSSLGSAFRAMVSRVVICTIVRELIELGAGIDLARGLPIVHVNFLGFDERAHRSGPGSTAACRELSRIDKAIHRLFGKAHRSRPTDYTVWVISDHGQETVRSFAREFPAGIGGIVSEGLKELGLSDHVSCRVVHQEVSRSSWLTSRRVWRRLEDQEKPGEGGGDDEEEEQEAKASGFVITARGPVGHLYFECSLSLEQKRRLADWLVVRGGVPGVVFRTTPGEALWVHPKGATRFPHDAGTFLPHAEGIREELARDLVALCEHRDAGEMILLGWNPEMHPWSFPLERGAHAGPGSSETGAFALLPAGTRLPDQASRCFRPSALREAALHLLNRRRLPPAVRRPPPEFRSLRVLSYNVHSCVGLDGRHSPGRVARIIRGFDPDVVALQEIDMCRPRSAGENHVELLAHELEMEAVFCCTVSREVEQYGHALLTRFPAEMILSECFEGGGAGLEPRGMAVVRIRVGTEEVYLANTHLGLSQRERVRQVEELMGERWLGRLPSNAPVVLCGDFNMRAGSLPYRMLTRRYRDVQLRSPNPAPLPTFVSPFPFIRLDYVFVSDHFEVENVRVPRNSLTGVASDHLPLLVDLKWRQSAQPAPRSADF